MTENVSKVTLGLILGLLLVLLLESFLPAASTQTVLLGVIVVLMAIVVVQTLGYSRGQSIEYKVVPAASLDQSTLGQFGRDGWHLICMDQQGTSYFSRS